MDALEGVKASECSAYATARIVHKEKRRASAACSGADAFFVFHALCRVLFSRHALLTRQMRCCAKGDTAHHRRAGGGVYSTLLHH
jgi:hypothetical protein